MTREERKEFNQMKEYIACCKDSITRLTIRIDASSSYKHALNDLFESIGFMPSYISSDSPDKKERICYLRSGGLPDNMHWTEFYGKTVSEKFISRLDSEPPKQPKPKLPPYETRYIITDIVNIPVTRINKQTEAFKYALKPGWGAIDEDEDGNLFCGEDISLDIYTTDGEYYGFSDGDPVDLSKLPKRYQIAAVIYEDGCGTTFWEREPDTVKIAVTYDECGLIDAHNVIAFAEPYEDETMLSFNDLIHSAVEEKIDRADIYGTLQYSRYHDPCEQQYHTLEDLKRMGQDMAKKSSRSATNIER